MSIPCRVDTSAISPAPADARLEVWLASPAAAAHFQPGQSSPAELRRYTTLRSARTRNEFAVSRALHAHVAPQATCTLSHSAGSAALAHGPAGLRLGIDLEHHRPRDFLSLARFAFAAEEVGALESLGGQARARHFYALWVMKEAMAKALGLVLLDALRRCIFTCDAGQWRGSIPRTGSWSPGSWSIFLFEPRAQASLALAACGNVPDSALRSYEWPPQQPATWPVTRIQAA